MTDLCSTTQRALMTGMMERNLAITFLNPDERVELGGQNFTHVPLLIALDVASSLEPSPTPW